MRESGGEGGDPERVRCLLVSGLILKATFVSICNVQPLEASAVVVLPSLDRQTYSSLSSRALLFFLLPFSGAAIPPSLLLSSMTFRRTSSSSYAARLFMVDLRLVKESTLLREAFSFSLEDLPSLSLATEAFRTDCFAICSWTGRYQEYF